MIHFKHHC